MTNFNTDNYTADSENQTNVFGTTLKTVPAQITEDVSELTDGDVFQLCRVSLDSVVRRIIAPSGVVKHAAAADNDFGFYKENADGTLSVLDADCLIDGADFTTAMAAKDLLSLNTSLDRELTVREHIAAALSITKKFDMALEKVWLCMTMNTKETTADKLLDLDIVVEYD